MVLQCRTLAFLVIPVIMKPFGFLQGFKIIYIKRVFIIKITLLVYLLEGVHGLTKS
jgi:hypothetical protein